MKKVIQLIKGNNIEQAIKELKGMQSGIDWNYEEADLPPGSWPEQQHRDGGIDSILNDLRCARFLPNIKDKEHFKKSAILRIQVLEGVKGAAEELDRVTATAAAAAEAELRRHEGGNN